MRLMLWSMAAAVAGIVAALLSHKDSGETRHATRVRDRLASRAEHQRGEKFEAVPGKMVPRRYVAGLQQKPAQGHRQRRRDAISMKTQLSGTRRQSDARGQVTFDSPTASTASTAGR